MDFRFTFDKAPKQVIEQFLIWRKSIGQESNCLQLLYLTFFSVSYRLRIKRFKQFWIWWLFRVKYQIINNIIIFETSLHLLPFSH